MFLLVPALAIALGVAVCLGLPAAVRRARVARALRGDWWTEFDREFRAYASRAWEAAREAERSS